MLRNDINLSDAKYFNADTGSLRLNFIYITDDEVISIIIPFLAKHTEITELELMGNIIGDMGVKALAANTTLRSLNLMASNTLNNGLGDEAAKALAANTTLTTLNLYQNAITTVGAKALAANTTLRHLNLLSNPFIGIEGIQALASNSTIETLELIGTHDEDRRKLQDRVRNEPNPTERANLGRKVGVTTEVPSLKHQTAFFITENEKLKAEADKKLPPDLKDILIKPKR